MSSNIRNVKNFTDMVYDVEYECLYGRFVLGVGESGWMVELEGRVTNYGGVLEAGFGL